LTLSNTGKEEVMTHTYESVLQHITSYLHNKLAGAPEVDAQAHFTKDLNINSLQVFEIVEELEETYQIIIPLELLYTHGSLIFIRVLRMYNALYFLPLYHFHVFL